MPNPQNPSLLANFSSSRSLDYTGTSCFACELTINHMSVASIVQKLESREKIHHDHQDPDPQLLSMRYLKKLHNLLAGILFHS